MAKKLEPKKRTTVKKTKAVTVSLAQQLKLHNTELGLENARLLDETQRHAQEITTGKPPMKFPKQSSIWKKQVNMPVKWATLRKPHASSMSRLG